MVNKLITLLSSILVSFLKDFWKHFKIKTISKELENQKEKSNEAKLSASDAYDNFKREYDEYLKSTADVRQPVEKVRGDSGDSENSN